MAKHVMVIRTLVVKVNDKDVRSLIKNPDAPEWFEGLIEADCFTEAREVDGEIDGIPTLDCTH